jgi:1,4-dihydroxy-6-naphthoate synthase
VSQRIQIAISTCPNDTFAFHPIIEKQIDLRGIEFEFQFLDIEQLNRGLFSGAFDVAKASFHAALLLSDKTFVLDTGAALGYGVGPLLLAADPKCRPSKLDSVQITLCPGEFTTATLLFKLFYGNETEIRQVLFSEIMPMLCAHSANFGVCIHEGRFTYSNYGLTMLDDLGARWEAETAYPLPLGGILARRSLAPTTIRDIQCVIRDSIRFASEHRNQTLPTMRAFAQEFDDNALFKHVDLYVNNWTVDLGETGRMAINKLYELAGSAGIVKRPTTPLSFFSDASD